MLSLHLGTFGDICIFVLVWGGGSPEIVLILVNSGPFLDIGYMQAQTVGWRRFLGILLWSAELLPRSCGLPGPLGSPPKAMY